MSSRIEPDDHRLPVTVLVLTYNEEANLAKCLDSVCPWVESVCIIDGYSSDRTLEIARSRGCRILQTDLRGYGAIYNWALKSLGAETKWLMRLDADETATEELRATLERELPVLGAEVTGLYVRRRIHFMGRWMRHGGCYPLWHLRVWQNGKGFCEERLADEHIVLTDGIARRVDGDIVDDNRRGLTWWVHKHNTYATREAIEQVRRMYGLYAGSGLEEKVFGDQAQRKRWINHHVYSRLPILVRPAIYFFYRYLFQLGFLDGREGLVWTFLQAFWYRFLVDSKILEIKKAMRERGLDAREAVFEVFGQRI